MEHPSTCTLENGFLKEGYIDWRLVKDWYDWFPSICWQDIFMFIVLPYILYNYNLRTLAIIAIPFWLISELIFTFLILPRYIKNMAKLPDVDKLSFKYSRYEVQKHLDYKFNNVILDPDLMKRYIEEWHDGIPLESVTMISMRSLLMDQFLEIMPGACVTEDEFEWFNNYVQKVEKVSHHTFKNGPTQFHYNVLTKWDKNCVRYPLAIYAILYFQNYLTSVALRFLGFRHRWAGRLEYWWRPPDSGVSNEPPQFFFHGIGIGLSPYYKFVSRLPRDRHVVVPEFRSVQLRIFQSCMDIQELVSSIQEIFRKHKLPPANISAHSYGSFVFFYVWTYAPHLVHNVVLIDPVNCGLDFVDGLRDVLYSDTNFCDPDLSWVMHYQYRGCVGFLKMGTLPPGATIILSELDKLVPSVYIRDLCIPTDTTCYMLIGETHGDFLFRRDGVNEIKNQMKKGFSNYTELSDEEDFIIEEMEDDEYKEIIKAVHPNKTSSFYQHHHAKIVKVRKTYATANNGIHHLKTNMLNLWDTMNQVHTLLNQTPDGEKIKKGVPKKQRGRSSTFRMCRTSHQITDT